MDKIQLCDPDARILKHMNVNVKRIEREIGRFIGLILPNGRVLQNYFDVYEFTQTYGKEHITFGSSHCTRKEEKTGNCLGHANYETNAPNDIKIKALRNDEIDLFDKIEHGRIHYYPRTRELANANEGDYITLTSANGEKSIKLVITCAVYYTPEDICCVGVWPVMQRTKASGKTQYFL